MPSIHTPSSALGLLACLLIVTATIPAAASHPRVKFSNPGYEADAGDIVSIPVELRSTDSATVVVRGYRVWPSTTKTRTYLANASVSDANGDGRATLLLDTHDVTWRARGPDEVNVTVRMASDGPLDAHHYDLYGVVENETGYDRTSESNLDLSKPEAESLKTWVGPSSVEVSAQTLSTSAPPARNVERSSVALRNGTLVFDLRTSGLGGAVESGPNATARFFDVLDGRQANLSVVQTNPGPSHPPKELHLGPNSTRVVADGFNQSYYLAVDLSAVNVTGGPNGELRRGDEYLANFSLRRANSTDSNRTWSVETKFAVGEAVRSTEGDAPAETTAGRTETETTTESSRPTTAEAETEPTDSTTDAQSTATARGGTPDGIVPGFGVGAALVALLAGLAFAGRK
ncbi:hypothetical protein [Halorussus sp. MSC15.2]|uniref:DUF7827 domain-containing protein n=1 Tax=Halorussus sp. MSC15.2 TaxID=2283638 RepID=UPI0013D7C7E0|nr:hypothetical protein [Halorussus sp. MSC15.2]NEU57494.1 hypothetical protein [Halorussus sp. MSC15.2]